MRLIRGGASTRSNTSVKKKVGLSAGGLYAGEGLRAEKYGMSSVSFVFASQHLIKECLIIEPARGQTFHVGS